MRRQVDPFSDRARFAPSQGRLPYASLKPPTARLAAQVSPIPHDFHSRFACANPTKENH